VRADLPPPPSEDALQRLQAGRRSAQEASRFFFDPGFRRAAVKVLPGEFFVHDQDVAITTTLGSCVSACLHDPTRGVGGMNHFMLPEASEAMACARYGVHAMEILLNALMKRGARREQLQAKIFGGGQVLPSLAGTLIGRRNVDFVQDFLANEGIALRGADVLDVHPRRICMFPRSGLVLCRRLPLMQAAGFEVQERDYRATLRRVAPGDVELF